MAADRAASALSRAVVTAVVLAISVAGAAAATVRVTIKDLGYAPQAITAGVGDVIEWTNNDFIAHTATATDGSFDVEIEPGAIAHATVSKAGTVDYYCVFHPDMTGKVTIRAN